VVDPLESAVTEVLSQLGFELVEFRRAGSPQRPLLQVRIEHRGADLPDVAVPAQSVTADDCVRASRAIEQSLEGRGLVGAEYTLEVSSPGSDRPLRGLEDWERFRGQRVKVKHRSFNGSRYGFIEEQRHSGTAAPGDEVAIRLEDGGEVLVLGLEGMKEARLAPKFEFKKKPGH
jgi:ribosome maturation factor RimP